MQPTESTTGHQAGDSAPGVLEELVRLAEKAGASDIHLQMQETGAAISFRLDGVMHAERQLPAELGERVIGRIKYLAKLKTYQELLPQDGRIDKGSLGARSDIRVATYPTITGEKVVLRLFEAGTIRSLAELAFPVPARRELQGFLRQTSGLLLLTGPAGSGKTTTIYACLRDLVGQGGKHIITVEDPAEQVVPGVMQTEVCEARGLGFAKAARHLLRQDPQVLVIGEVRDEETAAICVRAALTGHLVISTLHAGSCQGVFERFSSLCPDLSGVAAATELIFNQRLVRKLCGHCAGRGCPECLQTGYHGRLPLIEWLRVDEQVRHKVRARDLADMAAGTSLLDAAKQLVTAGVTNDTEIARVLGVQG